MKKTKIALIVERFPGQSAFFKNISQILSKKYDVRVYLLLQMPKFLSDLSARFSGLVRRKSSTDPQIQDKNEKQDDYRRAAVYGACTFFKSLSVKLIAIPKTVVAEFYLFVLSFYISLRYDAVITHDIHWVGAISTLCAKMFRKKSIIFVVGHYFDEIKIFYKDKGIYGILQLKLLSILEYISIHLADVIVTADYRDMEHLKEKRTKRMVFEKKLGMIDIQQFSYDQKIKELYRKKLGIPDTDSVLLFIGWLTEWDGAGMALDIYRELSKQPNNLWLVFIGSGDLETRIKKVIVEERMHKLILTGFVPHSEIHKYMMVGDIALMPLREPQCGIGNIPLELMALGIPIIATDVGMLREVIINYETGFIVNGDLIEGMVQRVKFLVENPNLTNKMRINARKMIEQDFSPEITEARIFSLINTCMDS